MKNFLKSIFLFAIASLITISCTSDDKLDKTSSSLSIKLVDAPGDYENVFIDVVSVEAIVDDETLVLQTNSGVYDLLTLTGGEFVDLVEEDIPTGNLSQLRLILGSNNSITLTDGQEFDLKTPSAQQSGLKLKVNYDLQPGVLYEFVMDFNVDKSIVELGNSGFILKPVIRISTEAETGAISGSITTPEVSALVTATNNEDATIEVSTFTHPETGAFLLSGVPEGTYTVVLEPDADSGLSSVTLENVSVEIGSTTTLEPVVFE